MASAADLFRAVNIGDLDAVQKAVEGGAPVDAAGREEKMTSLMIAAIRGHTNIAQYLLSKGAQVDARDSGNYTPLMQAAFRGHPDIVRMLLDKRANVNAQSVAHWTPLLCAAAEGHSDIVKLLLSRGADKKAVNAAGQNAHEVASKNSYPSVAALLR